MLSIDVKALVVIHAHGDRQVEMSLSTAGELHFDKPRIRPEHLLAPAAHSRERAAQKAG